MNIILASGSKYRQQQMQKLGISFTSIKPNIDESEHKNYKLSPCEFTLKLAHLKSQNVKEQNSQALIIASDQVAYCNQEYLEKSETFEQACEKLNKLQSQTHYLYTSLVVTTANRTYEHVDVTELKMRALSKDQIIKYVKKDDTLDCAGGYKFEQNGQFLFEQIQTKDPSSIIGLPMLKLTSILIENGVKIL